MISCLFDDADAEMLLSIAQDTLSCLSRGYSPEMYAAERGIPLGELEAILALYELEIIFNEYNERTDKNEHNT